MEYEWIVTNRLLSYRWIRRGYNQWEFSSHGTWAWSDSGHFYRESVWSPVVRPKSIASYSESSSATNVYPKWLCVLANRDWFHLKMTTRSHLWCSWDTLHGISSFLAIAGEPRYDPRGWRSTSDKSPWSIKSKMEQNGRQSTFSKYRLLRASSVEWIHLLISWMCFATFLSLIWWIGLNSSERKWCDFE